MAAGNDFGIPGAVLFDLDGTLVHSPLDFPRMKRDVLALAVVHGLEEAKLSHLDILGIVSAGARGFGNGSAFVAEAERLLTDIEVAASDRATVMAGAEELLRDLQHAGRPVGIVTRNCRPAAEMVLQRFDLPHQILLTRADVPRVKPDPTHLLMAAERLPAAPADCAMVGDHLMDVVAGRAAGMRTVGLLAPGRPQDFFDAAPPDRVIRQLNELRQWIFPSSS